MTISDVGAYPVAGTSAPKLAVRLDYRGPVRGSLTFWGTPTYDERTQRLSVPDLQVAPGTNGLLSGLAGVFFTRRGLIASLRDKATIELSRPLDEVSAAVSHTYVRQMGDGVSLEARVGHVSLRDVGLDRTGVTAHIAIDGNVKAEASVDVETLVPQAR